MKSTPAAFLFLISISAAAAARSPWADLTRADIVTIRDALRDNHPGVPDPRDPHYREWLTKGLTPALARADAAKSYDDYMRSLLFYTNGFSEDHITVFPALQQRLLSWAGFLVAAQPDNNTLHVAVAAPDAGVKVGDTLLSCDGKSVDDLLHERTDPYYWNAAIPHARMLQAWRLFYQGRNDEQATPASCVFSSGRVALHWRKTNIDELQPKIDAARGLGAHDVGMHKIGDVWMVTIPTFDFQTDTQLAQIKGFIDALNAKAPESRKGTVVFDVRGNRGGNTTWATTILSALWGREWIDHIQSQFDETVDWRASPANIAAVERNVATAQANGLKDNADYYERGAAAMRAALAKDEPYGRTVELSEIKLKPSENPVTGHVYLFTDGECASSCLIFADIIRRLPGTTHIGFPTFADTNYIDNTSLLLPSGLAYLNYSFKMYVHRVRANNEWYEPQIKWPGGPVTDESIAAWVTTLH